MESAKLHAVACQGIKAFEYLATHLESQIVVSTYAAFLQYIFSWEQKGPISGMKEQILDNRNDKTNHKIFEYCCLRGHQEDLENYMRQEYSNCEKRFFVFVTDQTKGGSV